MEQAKQARCIISPLRTLGGAFVRGVVPLHCLSMIARGSRALFLLLAGISKEMV